MADRVFVHIGLPKTATSFLQTIVWSNRERLRECGVVVPGSERRDHLWSSREIREQPSQATAPRRHRTAWARVRSELASSEGTGLISHEFFSSASAEQARTMVAALAPAEVHLVVTAREPLGLFAASWQESLKNGSPTPMSEYSRSVSDSSFVTWNWRTLDLRLVLERWGQAVPPERIHLVVLDPTAERDDVWRRFARLLDVDPASVDLSQSFPNSSMGVAQAETLRRMNTHLKNTFTKSYDKGVYLRTFLADERLVAQQGERFWPEDDQIEECRERGRRCVDHLRHGGYDISGRIEHLLVPDEIQPRRRPSSVSDAEVAQVAVALSATMLGDVRELRRELKRLRGRQSSRAFAPTHPVPRPDGDRRVAPSWSDRVLRRARTGLRRLRRQRDSARIQRESSRGA